jgi:hypothetical protein
MPGVEIADAVVEVSGGQQDLSRMDSKWGERVLVGLHECALADRGARLQVWQVGRPTAEAQPSDAGPDGARTDQAHLPPASAGAAELGGQLADAALVESPGSISQDVGADFHDHCVGPPNGLDADGVGHTPSAKLKRARSNNVS